jgi:flagellar hook-associated protein 3 FlgL
MRVATSTLQLQWLADVYRQQNDVAKLQQQVTSGYRISTAADDPAGASAAVTLQQGIDRLKTYAAGADTATRRLSLEENSLSQVQDTLTRVRELAVEAGGGDQTQQSRSAIASELDQLRSNLLSLANGQDGEGRYLFSGNQVSTQPFTQTAGGVTYQGDTSVRFQRIGDSRTIQEGDSGAAVFQDIPNGNGTYSVTATPGNQGSAFWSGATVTDPAAWVPGSYTISFTSPTDYTVQDAAANTVASGTWSSGQSIGFRGVAVQLEGTPVAGDSFGVSSSRKQDIFTTIGNLVATLQQGVGTPAQKAQFQSGLNEALGNLDQVDQHVSLVRGNVGSRLAAIDNQTAANQSLSDQLTSSLSTLRDVDYPQAISKLQQKMMGLDAAYQVYAKTQASSLFAVL